VLLASHTERNAQSIAVECPGRHQELGEIREMIKRFFPAETNQDHIRPKL
jgi:hypothetical protein